MKPNPSTAPATVRVPALAHATSETQTAFRAVIEAVEQLREQIQAIKTGQAEARRRYWQQVGPVAAAVVAARQALFAPLEEALLLGYFSRAEEGQITDFILANARTLHDRFGEDETAIIQKYQPQLAAPVEPEQAVSPTKPKANLQHPKKKSASAKAQHRAEEADRANVQLLAANAKTVYRQLARLHHPDLEPVAEKQAEKTVRMQQITAAYEADDLFALLQLLVDSGPADAAADDVLARYTQALTQQQRRMKLELQALHYDPTAAFAPTAKRQERELRQLKRDLRDEAAYISHTARLITQPGELREVLRQLAAASRESI